MCSLAAGEQVFDRRSAVKFYRIYSVEYGAINLTIEECIGFCHRMLMIQ